MGYFEAHADRLAGMSFKKDAQGRDLFYPHGWLGKGRILAGAWDAIVLRARLARLYRTSFKIQMCFSALLMVVLVGLVNFGFSSAIAYIFFGAIAVEAVVAGIGMAFYLRYLTSGYAISNERMSYAEHVRNCARTLSHAQLWLGALMTLLFVAPCVSRVFHGHFDILTLVIGLLFGVGFINCVSMIVTKLRGV